MSQAAAPSAATTPGANLLPDSTGIFTAGHLAVIALLAALTILAILYGIRLSRRRHLAEREVAAHNEEIAAAAPPSAVAEDRSPVASPVPPAPPPPAPLAPKPAPPPIVAAEVPGGGDVSTPSDDRAETGPSAADGPVTQLKGLGPKLAARLAELGFTTVGQVAALTDDEAAALDARLGPFTGRMGRDRWQEQARFLAAGDRAGFEAVFGRL